MLQKVLGPFKSGFLRTSYYRKYPLLKTEAPSLIRIDDLHAESSRSLLLNHLVSVARRPISSFSVTGSFKFNTLSE
jgi:hypothetical protein